jgi:hypothetical protein
VLKNLPDQELMMNMEEHCGNGRDDYLIRAMWNSVIAGTVFGHETIENLRRELKRNPCLLEMCGFMFSKEKKQFLLPGPTHDS